MIKYFLALTFFLQPGAEMIIARECTVPETLSDTGSFRLSINTFNHAELMTTGVVLYVVTNRFVRIYNTKLGGKRSLVYDKKIIAADSSIYALSRLTLDTLNDSYFNRRVLVTSGNEYNLSYSKIRYKKDISIHSYYLKEIDDIINRINTMLPVKYKIKYMSPDNIQINR